jgi:hypothetical protein
MRNAVRNAVRSPFPRAWWNAVRNAVPDAVTNAVRNAVGSSVEVEGEREENNRLLLHGRYRARSRIRRGSHAAAAVGSRHG